jgi:uncharacterized protein (TIGR02231 family)
MFRIILPICLFAASLHAETIEATGTITRVTLYPTGASVARSVEFTAPAGIHDLIVPGLPAGTPAGGLRVTGSDGVTIGAVSLAEGRLPAVGNKTTPEVKAAEDEVKRLEADLRAKTAAVATIRLKADAANEQVAFLHGIAQAKAGAALSAATLDDLRAITNLVGEQVLAALTTALTAEQEAITADLALEPDHKALEQAQQALAALADKDQNTSTLLLTIETASDGPARIEVMTITGDAGWQPVYDLRLTRGDSPSLLMERGVLVTQVSGEDWRGVDLTLSTARPSEQSDPSEVWTRRRNIVSEEELARLQAEDNERDAGGMAEPVMEPEVVVEEAAFGGYYIEMQGTTFTYHFPTPVDLRNGVDSLRLSLGDVTLTPKIVAEAVPSRDETAFLVADLENTGAETLLPGHALLYLDGALVGETDLDLIPVNGKSKIGFGAIDGIRLSRTVPQKSEGDQGILTKSNRQDETAILKIENLTAENWPMRVIDTVPYSEQDDLVVTYTADPPVTTADADGRRGVLTWEFDLAAGQTQEITLQHSLEWPDGFVLQ